jgi:outer membrane lipoprotein-sorting protein
MARTGTIGRRRLAWLAPAVVVGVVVAGVAIESSGASAAPRLAPRSTAQLLTAVARTSTTALTGTISETAAFGLPSLPGDAQSASLSWQTFLTGTHSVRVWVDGPRKQRLAVIGELSEADLVHNGRDLWTYTSDSNTASHTVLPARSRAHDVTGDRGIMTTPSAAVAQVLKRISPTTSVTLGPNVTVAGWPAYTLVVAPRDPHSTIRKVTIAIDSARYVPLRVEVYGSSATPAIDVGFSQVTFTRPAGSTFDFKIPAAAAVTRHPFSGNAPGTDHAVPMPRVPHSTRGAHPSVHGAGWTSVVELHNLAAAGGAAGLLQQFTAPVGTSGMRLLHTALINAVVTQDGRAFIGAVRPAALEHIAATTAH